MNSNQKYVILDRDGVINVDSKHYIKCPAEWVPIEGSLDAIARLSNAGYTVVVATNQSGLARGLFTQSDLDEIHGKLKSELKKIEVSLGGIFFCPHSPNANCNCRKPRTGMLDQIESFFSCNLKGAPFIGDSVKDIQAAQHHGCKPLLVGTGNGHLSRTELLGNGNQDFDYYADLASAVDALLKNENP
ncbi:MAG: D-glycero-beta-D-manno-heptose 1,7-bisphosphate 7-phosphatase [Pseudohongiellaceae bacterium]